MFFLEISEAVKYASVFFVRFNLPNLLLARTAKRSLILQLGTDLLPEKL